MMPSGVMAHGVIADAEHAEKILAGDIHQTEIALVDAFVESERCGCREAVMLGGDAFLHRI
jgi:hypothetical protein